MGDAAGRVGRPAGGDLDPIASDEEHDLALDHQEQLLLAAVDGGGGQPLAAAGRHERLDYLVRPPVCSPVRRNT